MNLDSLVHSTGEWLKGAGPDADVVVSSRIRLARNLAGFPFTSRASPAQKAEVESILRDTVGRLRDSAGLQYIAVHALEPLDCQFLVERQLISREHAQGRGPRGVAIDADERQSLMINEEDHLRLQILRSGLCLEEAWNDADHLDDLVEQHVTYAFSEEFGYLTACPTNVGTGLRASVMMHLPGLVMVGQIDKVFRALQKLNLTVRGLYGEGTRASGDFYQISNQVTLGKSEDDILRELRAVIPEIVQYERSARTAILEQKRDHLHDRIARAVGTLRSARMMTSEETIEYLSAVRLGVCLGLVEGLTIQTVNQLFLTVQPAHLQKIHGRALDGDDRNIVRANYLRARLSEISNN
ncbi:MAG: protein arginine kinase [Gemmataceae bacterium]